LKKPGASGHSLKGSTIPLAGAPISLCHIHPGTTNETALFLRPPNGQRQKSSQKLYLSYLSAKGEGEEKERGAFAPLGHPVGWNKKDILL